MKIDNNSNFFNQHCLILTRFAVLLIIGMMFTCSNENAPLEPPNVPTGFSAISISNDRVVLAWDDMEGVTHYDLLQNNVELDRNILDAHYIATNLTANTLYFFSLRACNEGGCSPQTNLILAIAPVTPESLSVEEVTSTTLSLSWLASPGAAHYVIDSGSIQITNQGGNNTSSTIPDLEAATPYTIKVKACSGYGCSPETSINITTIPVAPMNFTHGMVISTSVELKWEGVSGAGFYVVFRGGKPIITNWSGEENITTHTVTGLTSNTEEVFGVEACNNFGCSSRTSLNLITAPDTPQNLKVKNITSATVTLEWGAVTGAREYIIYREKTPVATNATLTHTVANLRFSTSYSFSVRACNPWGCSDWALKPVTTLEAPDFFSIAYPDMESVTPDISSPVFVSGRNCDIQDYHDNGKVRYSIGRNTIGSDELVLPTIDLTTGVVSNNGIASPGVYQVKVTVPENVNCNTDGLVYNTITPDDRFILKATINRGIGFHGNQGNFNYIITSQITDMSGLFKRKFSFNGDITEWDTSQVRDMSYMFYGKVNSPSAFNQPIGNWDTSQVEDMSWMFYRASNFNQPLSNWGTAQVEDMSGMFTWATSFNQPLSNWDTSQVRDMSRMFYRASNFNQPLSNWDTSQVRDMSRMFYGATSFKQPLSNWDTSQVENMKRMFEGAESFDQDLSGWVVTNVREHDDMFEGSPMAGKAEQHPKWP